MGVLLYTKMKLLLLPVLATVALAGHADYAKLQFAQFKEQYGKIYKTRTEHQMRFDIFQANLKKIEEHNKSGASWKKGINQFSDLTEAEFQAMYLGGYKRLPTPAGNFTTVSKPAKDLPTEVDWRKQGVVTDGYIRLQRQSTAQCGTDSSPMDGTACVGGPGNDEQHVCGQCGVLFDVSYPLGAHEFMMP